MFRLVLVVIGFMLFQCGMAQHLYYKQLKPQTILQFSDSSERLIAAPEDSLRKHQLAYVLKFYPKLDCKNIIIRYRFSKHIVNTKPKFLSLFKDPRQRVYKITFSKTTASVMDSVSITNLSFDAQIGLIANQISIIEDLSTGGIFNYLKFSVRRMSPKGRNKTYHEAEERSLEIGLGYQLLAFNKEFTEKLKIENWQSTKGYSTYIKYYRNRTMPIPLVSNLLNDLPVYIQHQYQ